MKDPLGELQRIHRERHRLEKQEALAILDARKKGHSWGDIGEALEITRQSAWNKFCVLETDGSIEDVKKAMKHSDPTTTTVYR